LKQANTSGPCWSVHLCQISTASFVVGCSPEICNIGGGQSGEPLVLGLQARGRGGTVVKQLSFSTTLAVFILPRGAISLGATKTK
jgi:hypothetical protein